MNDIDVLIVGAGPSGLMMAIDLTRRGLSCRIIDKNPSPSVNSKAIVIQPRTLEVFQQIGIIDRFLTEGLKLHALNQMSNGHCFAHLDFSSLSSPFPFALSLEQSKTEAILTEHLASLGVTIERQVELLSFESAADRVTAVLSDHKQQREEQITVPWLIGCGGAHSVVRKTSALPFEGKSFADVFSLADIHVKWKYPGDEVFAFPNAEGVLAVVPLPGKNRYRLIFQLKRCRNALKEGRGAVPNPTLDEIQAILRGSAGADATAFDPIWIANFNVNSRMTSRYRQGPLFLVGDAAHIHSPVGGQGMNTGLQDALNLGWKLALVHCKKAHPELLDTYQSERHGVGKKLLKATERATRVATLHNPLLIAIRNGLVSLLLRIPALRRYLMSALSQTAICYAKSLICWKSNPFSRGPQAGSRAPNAPLERQNAKTDLYALWQKKTLHQLLLFSGPDATPETMASLHQIAQRLSDRFPIQPLLIASPPTGVAPSVPVWIDPLNQAHRIYGASAPCACIIRPDCYIGYRQNRLDEAALICYFRATFS